MHSVTIFVTWYLLAWRSPILNIYEQKRQQRQERLPPQSAPPGRSHGVLPEITIEAYSEGEVLNAFNLSIIKQDLLSLSRSHWLNVQVRNNLTTFIKMILLHVILKNIVLQGINCSLALVVEQSTSADDRYSADIRQIFACSTFFYPKLMSSGHDGVKRWSKKSRSFL